MRRRDFLTGSACGLLSWRSFGASEETLLDNLAVQQFIQEMSIKHEFKSSELESFFSQLSKNDKVLRLLGTPQEKPAKVYWNEYRKKRLTSKNIAQGGRFWRRHQSILMKAEEVYGVPSHIIVAIIGVETRYGEYTGNFVVVEALATLAFFHPTRNLEFKKELVEFLIYAREQKINPFDIRGSYAGAFGVGQFLPSSVRKYAVDFDQDGRVNLFTVEDAVGSIAHFLNKHGWLREKGISYPAIAESDVSKLLIASEENAYQTTFSLDDLLKYSVHSSTAPKDEKALYVFIDLENRYNVEYRLGTENFYALTRYNKSFKYASIVNDLASAIQRSI